MKNNIYKFRHIARIVLEAQTPIAVGSGDTDFITDSPVLKDVNGLPYIPGTSIAGVIRHAIGHDKADNVFGYNNIKRPELSVGSNIIFTNALMIGKDGKVVEGLQNLEFIEDSFYKKFSALPIRQHNSINSKGTVKADGGKFDEQVVYKGTRYVFEIELLSFEEDDQNFNNIIHFLFSDEFRVGSGTRIGFGKMKVVTCKCRTIDMELEEDLKAYIQKSSSLNDSSFWSPIESKSTEVEQSENWDTYKLILTPDDFFLFGSGYGSDDADMTPVREAVITWNDGKPIFEDEHVLIPASSIKGAISHRVAYHYNRLNQVYADQIKESNSKVGENNTAVRELFGSSGMQDEDKKQLRGNVLFSDLFLKKTDVKEKILNHVAIDRFTGGAIDGALFQEEVVFGQNTNFSMDLKVNKLIKYNDKVIEALKYTLTDITTGMLPLGGGVNRGHGSFSGIVTCNDEPLKFELK